MKHILFLFLIILGFQSYAATTPALPQLVAQSLAFDEKAVSLRDLRKGTLTVVLKEPSEKTRLQIKLNKKFDAITVFAENEPNKFVVNTPRNYPLYLAKPTVKQKQDSSGRFIDGEIEVTVSGWDIFALPEGKISACLTDADGKEISDWIEFANSLSYFASYAQPRDVAQSLGKGADVQLPLKDWIASLLKETIQAASSMALYSVGVSYMYSMGPGKLPVELPLVLMTVKKFEATDVAILASAIVNAINEKRPSRQDADLVFDITVHESHLVLKIDSLELDMNNVILK